MEISRSQSEWQLKMRNIGGPNSRTVIRSGELLKCEQRNGLSKGKQGRKEEQSGRRKDGTASKYKRNGKCATPTRGARTFQKQRKKNTHINDLQRLIHVFVCFAYLNAARSRPCPDQNPRKCISLRTQWQLSAQTKLKCGKKWLKQMRCRFYRYFGEHLIFTCAIFSGCHLVSSERPRCVMNALTNDNNNCSQQRQQQQRSRWSAVWVGVAYALECLSLARMRRRAADGILRVSPERRRVCVKIEQIQLKSSVQCILIRRARTAVRAGRRSGKFTESATRKRQLPLLRLFLVIRKRFARERYWIARETPKWRIRQANAVLFH